MRRHPRGQSMVEFALVAPLLVLLIFGTIDIGRAVFAFATISEAANVAARTVIPGAGGIFAPPTNSAVVTAAQTRAGGVPITAAPTPACNALVTPTDPPAGQGWIYINPIATGLDPCTDVHSVTGHVPVRVTIRYRLIPVTPGIVPILPNGITLSAYATYTTEY